MMLLESLGSLCEHLFANLEPTEQMNSPELGQKYANEIKACNDTMFQVVKMASVSSRLVVEPIQPKNTET